MRAGIPVDIVALVSFEAKTPAERDKIVAAINRQGGSTLIAKLSASFDIQTQLTRAQIHAVEAELNDES